MQRRSFPNHGEMFATLGLREGSRVAISNVAISNIEGQIIVRPVQESVHAVLERIRDMVAAAPAPSLESILMELREEERHSEMRAPAPDRRLRRQTC